MIRTQRKHSSAADTQSVTLSTQNRVQKMYISNNF